MLESVSIITEGAWHKCCSALSWIVPVIVDLDAKTMGSGMQIKNTLGWEPKIALRDGLLLMIDDFKERLKHERPVNALA